MDNTEKKNISMAGLSFILFAISNLIVSIINSSEESDLVFFGIVSLIASGIIVYYLFSIQNSNLLLVIGVSVFALGTLLNASIYFKNIGAWLLFMVTIIILLIVLEEYVEALSYIKDLFEPIFYIPAIAIAISYVLIAVQNAFSSEKFIVTAILLSLIKYAAPCITLTAAFYYTLLWFYYPEGYEKPVKEKPTQTTKAEKQPKPAPVAADTTATDNLDNSNNSDTVVNVTKPKKKNLAPVIICALLIIAGASALTVIAIKSDFLSLKKQDIVEEPATQEQPTVSNIDSAKEAYALLKDATTTCKGLSDLIGELWHWTIFDAKDNKNPRAYLASETGLNGSELDEAFKNTIPKEMQQFGISVYDYKNIDFIFPALYYAYNKNGIIPDAQEKIETAKNKIHELSGNEPYYQDLKSYYTSVSAYFDFCCAPSGTYKDLNITVTNYETEITSYEKNLSFDLE